MTGESGIILEIVRPVNSLVFGSVVEYVGYIRNYEENLTSLRKNLSNVCNMKDDMNKKVKGGKDKQEEITREAASWLKDVRLLAENEELTGLMYKDLQIAKFVVKMMGRKDLKRRISKDGEMQGLVVKVMKKLKEEMEESEEENMRKMAEMDYKLIAEVMVEVMKDSIEEFKKLMKEDKKMAVIASRTLKDRDLDKLTKGDIEMEEIVREAGTVSDDEELWENDEKEEAKSLLVNLHSVDPDKNPVKEAARKLISPIGNLLTPLRKLMDDAKFKKAVPEAEAVKSRLDVIDGLSTKSGVVLRKEMDNTKQHRACCCCDYHGRYQISKAAQFMANLILDDIVSKCPRDLVTLRIRTADLKPIPSQFLSQGFDSRIKLLHRILEKLMDDQVDVVGVFGMGGIGKTTLAKGVNRRAKDIFSLKVMVEVSDVPDIKRIQGAIADSIDLPLVDVDNVAQRAIRLYNRLISEEKKVLVTLDNVWNKVNLEEIGIPKTCKLLLTTREREVCRVMGVREMNILEVGLMNTNESKELFKSRIGNKVDVVEYKNVVERLLIKCGGLPLAIVATANSLKDANLASWEKFVDDLEKPISSQVSTDYRHIYSILSTSYKFIDVDEKRMFLLLASLSPIGSSVAIKSLVQYGIGLNMFQYVNNLCEAIEQANKWATELVLSSMLLEGDIKGDFKIHDIVRAFAILLAAKEEGHKFMVEIIPRWLDNATFKSYTAMSLMSQNEYSRLNGVEAHKLQVLKLRGDLSSNLTDSFFNGMVNLEVLDLSNFNLQPSLPESIRKLKKLKTLCMERCKLGDIKQVGELVNLLVLSLRQSFVEELPNEIKELCNLRLLDLGECTSNKVPLIPVGMLSSLSNLEGLYLFNNRQSVFETKSGCEDTSSFVTDRLPYLNVLEIKLDRIEHLPINELSIQNLEKFRVCVGRQWPKIDKSYSQFSRLLEYKDVADKEGVLENSCLKVLIKKADCLSIEDCKKFENLIPQLNEDGFRDLSSLSVEYCGKVKCIIKVHKKNDFTAFPRLRSLNLSVLHKLEMICDGKAPSGMFSNVETLKLSYLGKLMYILPLAFLPPKLTQMHVSCCESLKFMFIENKDLAVIELPFLKSLELRLLSKLLSLVGPETFSNSDGSQGCRILFHEKIVFPCLEKFSLEACYNVEKLWRKEICTSNFQNLKEIMIERCSKLSSIASPAVFSVFVQLESLKIIWCDGMHEIITREEEDESESDEPIIRFPKLTYLELGHLDGLQCFYRGRSKLEFPKLKQLDLSTLGKSGLASANIRSLPVLFHERIDYPCLEELRSVDDEVTELWNWQALNVEGGSVTSSPAPMLRQLALGGKHGLQQIRSLRYENLSSLTLTNFENADVLLPSVRTNSQLPKLKELTIKKSKSLKELFTQEDSNFCAQLKTLELQELPTLNPLPLQLFKSLASLTLSELKWEFVISADLFTDSLQQLQFLAIENCENMVAILINVGLVLELPRLKKLRLGRLPVKNIFSPSKNKGTLRLPSLESLEINGCRKVEHFWSGIILAPRLQDIKLSFCESMHQFFTGNPEEVIELPSLVKVAIHACHGMSPFSSRPLDAPKLREVWINKCSRMEWFLPGNPNHSGELQLPCLDTLVIDRCPYLHSFSLGRVVAPKLSRLEFVTQEYSTLQFDDLNEFIRETRKCPKVRFRNSLI